MNVFRGLLGLGTSDPSCVSVLLCLVILICCSAGISCVEEQKKKMERFVFLQALRQLLAVSLRVQQGSDHLHCATGLS